MLTILQLDDILHISHSAIKIHFRLQLEVIKNTHFKGSLNKKHSIYIIMCCLMLIRSIMHLLSAAVIFYDDIFQNNSPEIP